MRKSFLIILVLLSFLSIQANSFAAQSSEANIILLDRKDQATTKITDGDTVHVQVTLTQPAQALQKTSTLRLMMRR